VPATGTLASQQREVGVCPIKGSQICDLDKAVAHVENCVELVTTQLIKQPPVIDLDQHTLKCAGRKCVVCAAEGPRCVTFEVELRERDRATHSIDDRIHRGRGYHPRRPTRVGFQRYETETPPVRNIFWRQIKLRGAHFVAERVMAHLNHRGVQVGLCRELRVEARVRFDRNHTT